MLINYFKKLFRKKSLYCYLFVFLLFYIKGLTFLDPDFGWRVKAGEYYWNYGIPKTDVFSYTMPDFPWVDHAWSLSLLFNLLEKHLGYPFLALFITLSVLVTILLISKGVKKSKIFKSRDFVILSKINPFSFFPLILAISIFFPFFGVRVQIVSWLFFSFLFFILSDQKILQKFKFFIPALFMLWANTHGSFAFGVVVLFIYLISETISQKKINLTNLTIFFLSITLTFINPYGWGVWREVWSSVSDQNLRFSISEWMPSLTLFDLSMVFYYCLTGIFVWKYRKSFSFYELVVYFFLLILAISSRRQLPIFVIFSLFLVMKGIEYFWNSLQKIKDGVKRFAKMYKIAFAICILLFLVQIFYVFKTSEALLDKSFYPVSAVAYLSQNIPQGEIFSDYGWGGYLIQNLPQKKVFIDGRMPSWRWSPKNEGNLASAFDTYNEILNGKTDYKVIFKKYNIDTVLARNVESEEGNFLWNLLKSLVTKLGYESSDFNLIEALEKDGWNKTYEDDISVIYSK